MLTDVKFDIYAPSHEYERVFTETNYDVEKTDSLCGSPFVSNQEPAYKIVDGVYYADLNIEHFFDRTNIEVLKSHTYWFVDPIKTENAYEKNREIHNKLFGSDEHEPHGVCDNYEQILKHQPHLTEGDQKHFIVLTPIYREYEPPNDGWRWSKWGDYIGDYTPQSEYLYDEDIDAVYVYRIFTLLDKENSKLLASIK